MGTVISISDARIKVPVKVKEEFTRDGAYSPKDLRYEIYAIADDLNLGPNIAIMVILSFTNGGLIETYDDLGNYNSWRTMIEDMLEIAFRDR